MEKHIPEDLDHLLTEGDIDELGLDPADEHDEPGGED